MRCVLTFSAEFQTVCIAVSHPRSPCHFLYTLQRGSHKLAVLLPQSFDRSCSVKQTNVGISTALTADTPIYAHTNVPTFPTCDFNLGSSALPASTAGDFGELILLWMNKSYEYLLLHRYLAWFSWVCCPYFASDWAWFTGLHPAFWCYTRRQQLKFFRSCFY